MNIIKICNKISTFEIKQYLLNIYRHNIIIKLLNVHHNICMYIYKNTMKFDFNIIDIKIL